MCGNIFGCADDRAKCRRGQREFTVRFSRCLLAAAAAKYIAMDYLTTRTHAVLRHSFIRRLLAKKTVLIGQPFATAYRPL